MVTKIYVNLVVKDLDKSREFFTRMEFTFNPTFTDESAACLVIGENIFAMLITENRFQDFTKKIISNAHKFTEAIISIDQESRQKVDEMIQKAIAAGGTIYREHEDYGWMYLHSFADLDGHQWEILYMNEQEMKDELRRNGKLS